MTETARRILVGSKQDFTFYHNINPEIPALKQIDLYLHIPFCKNLCPYCPYNRIPYDEKLVKPYTEAVLKEIKHYRSILGKTKISSIYIGGGTPTTITDELGTILKSINDSFEVTGETGIETSPSDLSKETIDKLRNYGIDLLSIGVQSFNNSFLKQIGRKYDSEKIYEIIDIVKKASFKSINLDLMFALPGQTAEDVVRDLEEAIQLGIDQVTTYPLFTFPYTSVGKQLKLNWVRMPGIFRRRKMYKTIHNYFAEQGYDRVSVWGFKKGNTPAYSSVTRNMYIGIGAGAGSSLPDSFYFNTFSVSEYIKTASKGKSPIALTMNLTPELRKYYNLYWQLYQTHISRGQFQDLYGRDNKIKTLFNLGKLLRLVEMKEDQINLTERGSFYIHLMQNFFVLNYIDKVWSAAIATGWPDKVRI